MNEINMRIWYAKGSNNQTNKQNEFMKPHAIMKSCSTPFTS